jgi:methyltransferase (TIGR00027 family)
LNDHASATARFVAAHVVLLGPEEHARLGIPETQIEWTMRCLQACGWSRAALTSRRWHWMSSLVERFSIPGIRAHYVLRKQIIEQEARRAIADGFQQIVVIAAGLDVLAIRLAEEFPEIAFIEMDQPATQQIKIAAVERWGCPRNLTFSALDLRSDGIEVPHGRTLFIAEGVFMYLSEQEVVKVLRSLHGRVIFTAMESLEGFRNSSPLVRGWLRRNGEPFRWAIAGDRVSAFLAQHRFNLQRMYGSDEIRARAHDRGAAEGEIIIVADD